MKTIKLCLLLVIISMSGCKKKDYIDSTKFTENIDGKKTSLYTLKNNSGMAVYITNYGGRIVGLLIPDKKGKITDVIAGHASLKEYKNPIRQYYGALIGRVGNRIANGKFSIDGTEYQLDKNNGKNTLHGGYSGYQDVIWDVTQRNDTVLTISYLSKDKEGNYPGNLKIKVKYAISNDNSLHIKYQATTDSKTIINLTNHAYFNLNGEGSGTILNHLLQIDANSITPVDSTLIPTGEFQTVENTPFDFRILSRIGSRIAERNTQLVYGKGYDHNFVLNNQLKYTKVATLIGDQSGIQMDVFTDQPGIQFYSGNFMNGSTKYKNGKTDDFRTALCLETQHFPDSPNHPNFPSIILDKGKTYTTYTSYKFSIKK